MDTVKGLRILACFIDVVCIGTVSTATSPWLPSYSLGKHNLLGMEVDLAIQFSLLAVPLYFLIFDFFGNGRTAGKMVTGIRVVDAETQAEPSTATRVVRSLLKCVSLSFWPISLLVYLMSSATLQDKVANTTSRREKGWQQTI